MNNEYILRQVVDSAGSVNTSIIFPNGEVRKAGYALTKLGARFHAWKARRTIKRLIRSINLNENEWRVGIGWTGEEWEIEVRQERFKVNEKT